MTYNEYDSTIHQSTEDACVEHNPHCSAFLGIAGLCEACWAEEHEQHTSRHCDEACPYCKPLIEALDQAEERLSGVTRILVGGILRSTSPAYLAQQAIHTTVNLWPSNRGMLARLHADGIALEIARNALRGAHNG